MKTNIQCDCGQFQIEISEFTDSTPGRAVCYCDDCQSFLHHLGRSELLDANGGSEVIPVYPSSIRILSGQEHLRCTRLSPKGLYRFSTTCCQTPVANLASGMPWAGISARMFHHSDSGILDRLLGPVKSRIMAKFAYGSIPKYASPMLQPRDFVFVLPFVIRGLILGKRTPSPFFKADGKTPVVTPEIIALDARNELRKKLGATLANR